MARGKADSADTTRTRREFVRDAGIAAAGATALSLPGAATSYARRARRRQTVAVFGGGIAGLTAAHELAERGFDVTVYERRAWGGKARSTEVQGTATAGRKALPGEHGFRFELGFYRNLPDTMRRIPFSSNPDGVWGNVVVAPDAVFVREGGRPDLYLPEDPMNPASLAPERALGTLMTLFGNPDLPPDATAHLASRLVVFLSSCDARRYEQWDNVTWTDFIDADRYGGDYRRFFGELPRFAQASKGPQTSTDWIGTAAEALVLCLSGRGDGPFWRLLDGPTNEKWIGPWIEHLERLGVRLRLGQAVDRLHFRDGQIVGARVTGRRGTHEVEADWYVCALPVERARGLWSRRILAADPRLGLMDRMSTGWMNGLKLFLRESRPIARGVVTYIDGPWAVTSVNQAQFWGTDFARAYGDGHARDSLSVVVSDWDAPGVIYGKPARECTPEQVIHEVWETIKRAVNNPGEPPKLTDELLLSWDIDPGMKLRDGHLVSGDPLVLPTVGQRRFRPNVVTAIPNLLLAGDYLLGDWLIGTMEAANETGRRAANVVLERTGSKEPPAATFRHDRLQEWQPFQEADEVRFGRGQPNVFDTEMSPTRLGELLSADEALLARMG